MFVLYRLYMCVCKYIYIYAYSEKERERKRVYNGQWILYPCIIELKIWNAYAQCSWRTLYNHTAVELWRIWVVRGRHGQYARRKKPSDPTKLILPIDIFGADYSVRCILSKWDPFKLLLFFIPSKNWLGEANFVF